MKLFRARINQTTEVITYFIIAEDEIEAIEKIRKKGYPVSEEKELKSIKVYEVKNGIDFTFETLLPDH
jgi:hypothetical protein